MKQLTTLSQFVRLINVAVFIVCTGLAACGINKKDNSSVLASVSKSQKNHIEGRSTFKHESTSAKPLKINKDYPLQVTHHSNPQIDLFSIAWKVQFHNTTQQEINITDIQLQIGKEKHHSISAFCFSTKNIAAQATKEEEFRFFRLGAELGRLENMTITLNCYSDGKLVGKTAFDVPETATNMGSATSSTQTFTIPKNLENLRKFFKKAQNLIQETNKKNPMDPLRGNRAVKCIVKSLDAIDGDEFFVHLVEIDEDSARNFGLYKQAGPGRISREPYDELFKDLSSLKFSTEWRQEKENIKKLHKKYEKAFLAGTEEEQEKYLGELEQKFEALLK